MIIGFGHSARVGKDTAALALVRDLGYVRRGFADALKDLAYHSNPQIIANNGTINISNDTGRMKYVLSAEGGWERAKDKWPEVRRYLQDLGTACRDVLSDDIWIDHVLKARGRPDRLVIPDVRYMNEVDAIHGAGGVVVCITRPGHSPTGHRSETELADYKDWDHVFANDGTIPELEAQVVAWAKGLKDESPERD